MLAGSLGDEADDDDRQSMGFQMGNARLLKKPQNNYVWLLPVTNHCLRLLQTKNIVGREYNLKTLIKATVNKYLNYTNFPKNKKKMLRQS